MSFLVNFLIISGIVLNAIILLILLRTKTINLSNKVLSVIFISTLSILLVFYSILNEIRWLYFLSLLIEDSSSLTLGPLIYLYVNSIISPKKITLKGYFPYFIPGILHLLLFTTPYILSKIFHFPFLEHVENIVPFINFEILYTLIFFLLSLKQLSLYQKRAKENFSNLENKNLEWIKKLLVGVIFTILLDLSTSIYEIIWGGLPWNIGYITIVFLIFVIGFLGYFGITQSHILLPDFLIEKTPPAFKPNLNDDTVVNTESFKLLQEQLKEIMLSQRPFLKENLTLSGLASDLNTTDKKLSILLNQYMKTSFYDFINLHRIEAVKEKINNPEYNHYTLLAIGFDSGFNSKTSFNRVFKNTVGISPSEYKKSTII